MAAPSSKAFKTFSLVRASNKVDICDFHTKIKEEKKRRREKKRKVESRNRNRKVGKNERKRHQKYKQNKSSAISCEL